MEKDLQRETFVTQSEFVDRDVLLFIERRFAENLDQIPVLEIILKRNLEAWLTPPPFKN